MSDLRPVLERIRDGFVPPEGALERLAARRARKRRNQRFGAAVVALTLSGAAVVGLWSVIRVAPRPTSLPGILPGEALDVGVGDGSVWVLTCDRRCGDDGRRSEGSLVRIDPVTKRAVASAPVIRPHALAVSEGAVWVVDFWGSRVTRFDPRTMRPVASIQLRLPFDICENGCPDARDFIPLDVAAGEGAVWVSTGRGVLARIDPIANTVVDMVRLHGDTTGGVAAGDGAVWVTENVQGLFRIDPSTNRVVAKITVDGEDGRRLAIDQVATGGGAVWVEGGWAQGSDETGYVVSKGAALVRLDPSTGGVQTRILLPASGRVAVGEGVAWVVSDGSLAAFDPSGHVIGKPLAGTGGILAPDGRAVWVANGHRLWKAVLCPTGPCIEQESSVRPSPPPTLPANAIVFARAGSDSLDAQIEIVFVPAAGGDVLPLTTAWKDGMVAAEPHWSPDGSRIAFVTSPRGHLSRYAGDGDIYVMDVDGTDIRRLTHGLDASAPTWSPDGLRIAFVRNQGQELVVMGADGSNQQVIAGRRGHYQSPAWSPDGRAIAYQSTPVADKEVTAIFTIRPDGTGERQLTDGSASEGFPAWSPDGSQIAYSAGERLWIMDGDGNHAHQVTHCRLPCVADFAPAWSPDASHLVFVRQEEGGAARRLYLMDLATGAVKLLTPEVRWAGSPDWRPLKG